MGEELVDVVDEKGSTLRTATKAEAHANGLLHKTVIGYLKNGDEWVFARQARHKQDANQLVAAVGGHVQAGETEEDALYRESAEEIGTRNIMHTFVGNAQFRRTVHGNDENHYFVIYEIATKDTLHFNGETVEFTHFTSEKLRQALLNEPNEFGDGFYFVFEKFYPSYLPLNYRRRWS